MPTELSSRNGELGVLQGVVCPVTAKWGVHIVLGMHQGHPSFVLQRVSFGSRGGFKAVRGNWTSRS